MSLRLGWGSTSRGSQLVGWLWFGVGVLSGCLTHAVEEDEHIALTEGAKRAGDERAKLLELDEGTCLEELTFVLLGGRCGLR